MKKKKRDKYVFVHPPEDYPGKTYKGFVYEHRLVWWMKTGDLVPEGYVVHHKNGKRSDNRIENLELMPMPEHSAMHSSTGVTVVYLVCPHCKETFVRARNATHLAKGRGKRSFCSRSCSSKYYSKNGPSLTAERKTWSIAECGTRARYSRGCRCDKCREANALASRERRARGKC